MNKEKKGIVLVTSLLCLLPVIFSVAVYHLLPERVAIHWNSVGVADNEVHKAIAAFGLPMIFLAMNLYSKMRLFNDPKKGGQAHAIVTLSTWLVPVGSIILVPVTLAMAMGAKIPIVMLGSVLAGVLLIVVGNYLPKNRQNYTIGIKLPWTLSDENNWNKVQRMAGYLWIVGGMLLIAGNFLMRQPVAHVSVTVVAVVLLVLLPAIYSYSLYAREREVKQ